MSIAILELSISDIVTAPGNALLLDGSRAMTGNIEFTDATCYIGRSGPDLNILSPNGIALDCVVLALTTNLTHIDLNGSNDTTLSRSAAGVISVGTGSGALNAGTLRADGGIVTSGLVDGVDVSTIPSSYLDLGGINPMQGSLDMGTNTIDDVGGLNMSGNFDLAGNTFYFDGMNFLQDDGFGTVEVYAQFEFTSDVYLALSYGLSWDTSGCAIYEGSGNLTVEAQSGDVVVYANYLQLANNSVNSVSNPDTTGYIEIKDNSGSIIKLAVIT